MAYKKIATVLVTGAGGFIGAELLRQLAVRPDLHVIAIDSNVSGRPSSQRLRWVNGDLCEVDCRREALAAGVDAIIHLAAVPGGAAEADPTLSQRVNIDATLDLLREAARPGHAPRIVFSSTIAVFGDPLLAQGVDDATPLRPRMIYGAHKAMVEIMLATLSRRGSIDGIALRLPGIVARPQGPSGLKSAFMSELFHRLREARPFLSPVSRQASFWLMSVKQCAANLVHALDVDTARVPVERVLTLPALRVRMDDLAGAVARHTGSDPESVEYAPDAALERAFGTHPPLATPAAEAVGFRHDGSLDALVEAALETITRA
jgi:nucleoside-diphosphate-sugar epimerase